jgi:acetylornithine deacetylase/succinyl-diaminopimelate desuccinylase-like protein
MSALRRTVSSAFLFGLLPPAAALAEPFPEAVRWLQEYIQIDTTNPPGNEREAAEFLAAILRGEGIEPRLFESPEGRTSLYARLEAPSPGGEKRDAGALVLMHHLDVVPAGPGWRVPPFSGRPLEGKIWGRGALDVKGLGIAHLAALVALKRDGAALDRDLIYLAVADEETGGGQGAGWLLEAHPELFDGVAAVLGEGGSNRVFGDRLVWWGVEMTQKRPLWLRVTARGRAGHASGLHPESATHQLIAGLARLIERPPRYRVPDGVRPFLRALARLEGDSPSSLYYRIDDVIREEGPTETLPPGMPVFFVDSLQVTRIDGSTAGNVVTPEASATVDIRMLPETDADALLAEIREILGDRLEVEVVLTAPAAPASPTDHPVYRALEETLSVRGPVVPTFISGTTDSRYFRERGIPAYGFSPFSINSDDLGGIHAPDEYLPADSLLRGIEMMRRVLVACAGR